VALRARLILAHGLEAQGRVAEADAVYREAAGSGDGPAEELHARQFHATWLMAQGRREEARQVLEQGIALATGQRDLNIDARMRQLLGEVHFQEGRMREAEDCLSKVVEYRLKWNSADHKRSTLALRWHGRALHNLGRYTEAVGPFEKVVAADWVEPQDRFWLGASLLALGRDEEGRDQILLAVSKGRATTPGQRPWDEAAGRAVEALRAGGFRFDATLAERLGDLKWLAGPVPSEAVTTDDER
jgi:hypothetical protein